MVKKKKVGIKHFLNKQLKPTLDEGKYRFSLYTRITFNRKNTQFPSYLPLSIFGLTEEEYTSYFENRKNEGQLKEVEEFNKEVEKIIQFEFEILGDGFSLRNFNDRYSSYHDNLILLANDMVSRKLSDFVKGLSSDILNEDKKTSINTLLTDAPFFASNYKLLSDFIPNLRAMIPNDLALELTALIHLSYARLQMTKEYEPFDVNRIDWLNIDIRRQYKEYILNQPTEEEIFKKEAKNSPVRFLYNEFAINPNMVGNYLTVVNKFVAGFYD